MKDFMVKFTKSKRFFICKGDKLIEDENFFKIGNNVFLKSKIEFIKQLGEDINE